MVTTGRAICYGIAITTTFENLTVNMCHIVTPLVNWFFIRCCINQRKHENSTAMSQYSKSRFHINLPLYHGRQFLRNLVGSYSLLFLPVPSHLLFCLPPFPLLPSRSSDMMKPPKFFNESHDLTTPLSGMVCRPKAATCTFNLYIKFKVFVITNYEDV